MICNTQNVLFLPFLTIRDINYLINLKLRINAAAFNMKKFSKLSVGFSFLDQKWGGVYPGGNYFIIGSKYAGKTLLALKIIENFINSGHKIILFSNQRMKNLEIQAASLLFDIEEPIKNGKLIFRKTDEFLNSIENLKDLVDKENPSIFIFDKIIQNSFIDSSDKYLQILEILEQKNITLFLTSSLPKTESSIKILKEIIQFSTGIIQLHKSSERRNYSGQVTIKPNVGHIEGEFETNYKVDSQKGFITLADNENNLFTILSKANTEYDNISQNIEEFDYSNIYDYDEFVLFLENKKSLIADTNIEMNLIIFEIKNGIAKMIELCKTLQKSLKLGDKISYKNKTVYVFPQNCSNTETNELIASLRNTIIDSYKNVEDIKNKITIKKQSLTPEFSLK